MGKIGYKWKDGLIDDCEGYTTPDNESPFQGELPAMISTTTNRDTLQYKSMGVRHDRT